MNDLIPVENTHTDFFITGNGYMRESLNLKFIPRVNFCNNDNWGGYLLLIPTKTLTKAI